MHFLLFLKKRQNLQSSSAANYTWRFKEGSTELEIIHKKSKFQLRKFDKRKIVIIFLPIDSNMCFGCSKEPFGYPQHMFRMKNVENSFPIRTLIWGLTKKVRTFTMTKDRL